MVESTSGKQDVLMVVGIWFVIEGLNTDKAIMRLAASSTDDPADGMFRSTQGTFAIT